MLLDAQVSFIISHSSLVNSFELDSLGKMRVICLDNEWDRIAQASQENPISDTTTDNLAYVIYTSGSTGKPKGVLGLHQGAINRFNWMWENYPFTKGEVCCQKTSLNFVDSVWEIFGGLLQGVKTLIIADRIVKDPHQFVKTLASHNVTRLVLVPSLLRVLLDINNDLQKQLPKLKFWISSGETLTIELLHKFRQILPDSTLLNLYGSSEVSADVTCYSITPTDLVPERVAIGRAIANTQIHVLDKHLQPVPVGVAGELYVSGVGLARGYLNHPEMTAKRFISEKIGGKRLYKTGDLARYRTDGNLEFLGRIDHQVKLRGFRIELGEITAVLSQHPRVQDSVVVVREDEFIQQLVAYIVSDSQQVINMSELHRLLKEKLPEFMIPSALVMLEALPLLPNGKVNYEALPLPEGVRPELEQQLQLPQTEAEQVIASIWQEVLRIDQVGIHDNFFELGGYSLLLVQVYSKLQERFKRDFSLVEMFQYPTINHLAKFLSQESSSQLSIGKNNREFESKSASISSYLFTNLFSNFYPHWDLLKPVESFQMFAGNDKDHLPTQISYKLNLKSPSVNVQTACSTSLVAVHFACQSLLNGESDIALAGGVSITVPQTTGYYYEEGGILAADGHCRAFDASASGTIFSNGLGVVVLKRLEDALSDRDYIHAVIKGSAINNDGSLKVGYTAPSVDGQTAVILEALALADVDPETISYIETHGTGTSLGDPIEIAALTQAFRCSTDKKGFCAIASVKTNIGHLNTAAGVAGLIKIVQALKHKKIPANLHFKAPNPQIDFANSPFYVNTKLSEWQTNGTPRRAGVSSFGIGGTNAHVILEEAPIQVKIQNSKGASALGRQRGGRVSRHKATAVGSADLYPYGEASYAQRLVGAASRREEKQLAFKNEYLLLCLSAKSEKALEQITANFLTHLQQHPELNLADVAYTLNIGRRAFDYRRMVVCHDIDDALNALTNLDPQRVFTCYQKPSNRPVVFMFSG